MKTFLVVGALAVVAGQVARGQNLASSPCPAGSATVVGGVSIPNQARAAQDACTQAYDLFQFMAPQLGVSLAGGNAILGQGGTLGGFPHLSVGVRANIISGLLPDVANFTQSTNGAQRQTLPTKQQLIGLPTADAAVGIFKGIPLGVTNVGGVDALVSAEYVPSINANNVKITPSQNLQLGYGARIGLLQESIIMPGVSASYIRRDLPKTDIVGTTGNDTLKISNAKVTTAAWRVTASKSLLLFSLAAGFGREKYDQSGDFYAAVSGPINGNTSVPNTSQSLTRNNYFLDASMNLLILKLVGEVGQVSGGKVDTYNSFKGGAADRSLTYFSVGARLGW
jgi:hypothetical protein